MKQKLVVGGFASTEKQITIVAEKLSQYFDEDVQGINYRKARAESRGFFSGREVIAHSAAMQAISGSMPDRLIAIAPPRPEKIRKLLWRGAFIGAKIRDVSSTDVGDEGSSLRDELLHHPLGNFGAFASISHFDALMATSNYLESGVPTTVVLMHNDELFTSPVNHSSDFSVTKIISIPGDHCRFTREPAEVLAEIMQAEQSENVY